MIHTSSCVFIHFKWSFASCLQSVLTNDPSHPALVKEKWCCVLFRADSTAIESSQSDLGRCIFTPGKEDFWKHLGVSHSVFSLYIRWMSNQVLYIVWEDGATGMHFLSSPGQWAPWQVHQYDSCCADKLCSNSPNISSNWSRCDAGGFKCNTKLLGRV